MLESMSILDRAPLLGTGLAGGDESRLWGDCEARLEAFDFTMARARRS
jgi:hypothetical protein